MVCARIYRNERGITIKCQRDKYKHWFALGRHRETDAAFESALQAGTVVWNREIFDATKLF